MRRFVIALLVVLFAAWTAYTAFTRVESYQRGVVRRFGRVLEYKPQPGLHIGLPWGIDRVDLAPVGAARVLDVGYKDAEEAGDESTPAGQLLTGDHNLVNVQATISFNVRDDDADIVRYVLNQDAIDAFVSRAAESLLAEWIAARTINYIIQHGGAELPRFLQKQIQDRIDSYDIGVEVRLVSIPLLKTPDQVRRAFERVAEAENAIKALVKQADKMAYSRLSEAKSEAFKLNEKAHSFAKIQRENAKTEAENFNRSLKQYRDLSSKNPDYLNARWLEEMTRLYTRMRAEGRVELLDHYLSSEGLTITQFPLTPKKK